MNSFNMIWPISLVVISNIFYQICAKSVPWDVNPFAALTVTYVVGALASLIIYFVLRNGGSLGEEYSKLNWSSFVLGLCIVGLEVGVMFSYKNGWPISTFQVVQGGFLAIALIFVGLGLYHEQLSWNKIAGIIVSLVGLFLINLK